MMTRLMVLPSDESTSPRLIEEPRPILPVRHAVVKLRCAFRGLVAQQAEKGMHNSLLEVR
jgi:hypothetical protein